MRGFIRSGKVHDLAFRVYRYGVAVCERAGILPADTKLEFGVDAATGELLLVDGVIGR